MAGFTIKDGEVIQIGIWAGDVVLYQGTRYKVTKVKQVNYAVMDAAGKSWNLRIHPSVVKDTDQTWDGPKEKTEWDLHLEREALGLTLGSCVRLKSATHKRKYPEKYIVISLPASGKVKMAKLGGDAGRYLHGFLPAELEIVPVSEI